MNDFELNKAIVEKVLLGVTSVFKLHTGAIEVQSKGRAPIIFDYNDWNDLMPLVVKHKIVPEYSDNGEMFYACVKYRDNSGEFEREKHHTENKNSQLALVECLLKVLEANND